MAQLGHRAVRVPRRQRAAGPALFAGAVLVVIGAFHAVLAVAAMQRSPLYAVDGGYLFGFDLAAWGWTHLGLAVLLAAAGWALVTGVRGAVAAGIAVAGLSAVGNFLFVPFQPLWAMLIIAVDVAAIWALAAREQQE